jgi:transmembrane sensor
LDKVVWYRSRRAILTPLLAAAAVCLVVAGVLFQQFWRSGVSTSVGEQRTLNLEDGTRVALNTDSRIVVRYDRRMRTVVLKSGEAYFQVAREARPFVVIAGDRKVLALGTAFTVRREDAGTGELTVTLLEGRVAVEPVDTKGPAAAKSASEVNILNPGEQLRVHHHAAATVVATSTEKATGWMRGQLIFDHTPLNDAIAEFNRYSDVKITVASPSTGAIPVGGIFRISDSKSFARAVAQTHNLRLTLRDNSLILDNPQGTLRPRDPRAAATTARCGHTRGCGNSVDNTLLQTAIRDAGAVASWAQ